jgi:hypothetical protein
VNFLVLEFYNIFVGHIEIAQLSDFLLLDLLQQSLLSLKRLLQLLVLDVADFLVLLIGFVFFNNLFLQLDSVLLQQLFALVLQFLLQLSDFFLFANDVLKLRFFSSGLFFEHSLFFSLLLVPGLLQLLCSFGSDLCFDSLFLSCNSLVGFSCSFGSQSIQLSLSI